MLCSESRAGRGAEDPYWNESAWFGLMIPERKIHGFVYFWHRNNMNKRSRCQRVTV